MKKLLLCLVLFLAACSGQDSGQNADNNTATAEASDEVSKWEAQAKNITIIRDNWGIPHIYGKTDADAVFGLMYAQAEDDFNRIEVNYMNAMGLLAQAEGEAELYRDLRMKLFIQKDEMKRLYAKSPEWLKKLMNAYADGLNYYLHMHPEVTPKVIKRFEPWMALSFSEGSIGGDIESVDLGELESFYGGYPVGKLAYVSEDDEPRGSNGFAIAPRITETGNAMLLINPHTSFFFRAEVHMVSEEGLNAYGAVTWGQFFIYQGFNEKNGWMHTSSRTDVIDHYLETVIKKDDGVYYLYEGEERKFKEVTWNLPYKDGDAMKTKDITVYHSHHGPVIREEDGKWVSIKLMNDPMNALMQSYNRTKTANLDEYHDVMKLKANSSNNTVYADADGNIAYYHGNFVPRRDTSFDWSKPVDGSIHATEWQGLHDMDEIIVYKNPENGWLQNTNNWSYSAAGEYSYEVGSFPKYMDPHTENPRGIHAIKVLTDKKDFTLDRLIGAAYDEYLSAFDRLFPPLFAAYDQSNDNDLKASVVEQIEALKAWDRRYSVGSTETSLAVYWGQEMAKLVPDDLQDDGELFHGYMADGATVQQKLEALKAASDILARDFGDWKTPWGEINRFQRITGDVRQDFTDEGDSIGAPYVSSRWGSLAAYGSRTYPGTKRMYGTSGNSFVAVVEFGDKVKAKAITAGGLSGDPSNKHFDDQEQIYVDGNFRDVYYYREDVDANIERQYQPGE